MTSKAQRRKRKNKRVTLAGGVSVPQKATGRDRTHTHQQEDARGPVLAARCRMSGNAETQEQVRASASPLRASPVGMCIEATHGSGSEAMQLLGIWHDTLAALEAWRQRNTGQTGNPKAASIAMIPDRVETDPSLTVDLRTPEERDYSARRRAEAWEAIIRRLPPQLSGALRGARDGFMDGEAIWRDAAPTARGRLVVKALEMVEAMNGR